MKTCLAALIVFMAASSAKGEAAPDIDPDKIAAPMLSSDVFEAARFAVRDRKVRLLNIQSAERQSEKIVSYRLCLLVRGDGQWFRAAAEIGRSGPHKLALTRWFPGGC